MKKLHLSMFMACLKQLLPEFDLENMEGKELSKYSLKIMIILELSMI